METTIEVHEASQVAEVRRVAARMALAHEMSETEAGKLALVVTEASTNLVKYARQGTVTLRNFDRGGQRGVEIIAVDHGPGLLDPAASMRDGHTASGSLGIGLGTMQRASSYFDVYSVVGQGTAVLARVARGTAARGAPAPSFLAATRCRAMKGQTECGDGWRVRDFGPRQMVCIVDGLGHGPLAARAARRAIEVFESASPADAPGDIVQRAHEGLRETRGAVMAVLALDARAGTATYCGVGNIAALILSDEPAQHLLSIDGTVGYNLRKVRTQQAAWLPGATAILNTDGLSGRWNLSRYPGLLSRDPGLIASILFRDHARDTDDATLVVAKAL